MYNWKDARNYRRFRDENGNVIANIIYVDGKEVAVSDEVYEAYASMDRRERYLTDESDTPQDLSFEQCVEDCVPFGLLYENSCGNLEEDLERKEMLCIVYDDSAVEGGWETLSQEEIEQRLNDKVQAGMINISCNTAPYFKDGKSEGNVMLVNELNNLYPQKVEFYRNDTGEKIYESKAIAVGSKIERAKLDVELPAGEHECTAYFSNLDPDSGATLGVAGAIIHITIQH